MIFQTPADKVERFIKAFDRLNYREQEFLTKHIAHGVKYEHLGKEASITRQRVQQIISSAMKFLVDELDNTI